MLAVHRVVATTLVLMSIGCAGVEENLKQESRTEPVQRHTLKALRDQNVVKQQLDYSCGSAALATLMIYYFGEKTSEREILKRLFDPMTEDERKQKATKGFSLLDLKQVANGMGYDAEGFKVSVQDLVQLSAPVIVFVEPLGYKHFAVLRGLSWGRVYLADPARGNLRMSLERFLDEWREGIIFVLGKEGEEDITNYPLAIHHNEDYGQPELVRVGGQLDLNMLTQMLPLR